MLKGKYREPRFLSGISPVESAWRPWASFGSHVQKARGGLGGSASSLRLLGIRVLVRGGLARSDRATIHRGLLERMAQEGVDKTGVLGLAWRGQI